MKVGIGLHDLLMAGHHTNKLAYELYYIVLALSELCTVTDLDPVHRPRTSFRTLWTGDPHVDCVINRIQVSAPTHHKLTSIDFQPATQRLAFRSPILQSAVCA